MPSCLLLVLGDPSLLSYLQPPAWPTIATSIWETTRTSLVVPPSVSDLPQSPVWGIRAVHATAESLWNKISLKQFASISVHLCLISSSLQPAPQGYWWPTPAEAAMRLVTNKAPRCLNMLWGAFRYFSQFICGILTLGKTGIMSPKF